MPIVVIEPAGTDWAQFWASFLSAVGTFLAVGVALWVAIRDGRRRDAERRDEQAAQARLVTFENDTSGSASEPAKVNMVNHSSAPVHAVELLSVIGVDRGTGERFAASRLGAAIELPYAHPRMLRPYGARDGSDMWRTNPQGWAPEEQPDAEQVWHPRSGDWSGADFEVRYRFTDNAGLRWERLNNNAPQRVIEDAEN